MRGEFKDRARSSFVTITQHHVMPYTEVQSASSKPAHHVHGDELEYKDDVSKLTECVYRPWKDKLRVGSERNVFG